MKKNSVLIILFFYSFSSFAQNADSIWFLNNYTKMERYITMRDGVRLFTSMYIPKNKDEKHPILMTRTPYTCSPYGEDKFMDIWYSYKMAYAKENFIFVMQDV
jgi:predicted acyl esterase